jgi:hypothetical protein
MTYIVYCILLASAISVAILRRAWYVAVHLAEMQPLFECTAARPNSSSLDVFYPDLHVYTSE